MAALVEQTPPRQEDLEEEDTFPAPDGQIVLDLREMLLHNNNYRGDASVATTELASAIGSTVGPPRDAWLKSFTFSKKSLLAIEANGNSDTTEWGISFTTHNSNSRGARRSSSSSNSSNTQLSSKLYVDSIQGLLALSKIKQGDYLKSINQKRIGVSYNAERALQKMHTSLEEEGILSIATQNKQGDDILVQATVLKPSSNMTLKELGLTVWRWPALCIKSISKDSLFKHSALKSNDDIISVNDIACDDVTPEQFAHLVKELPLDVTITVLRRKQRLSGMFG